MENRPGAGETVKCLMKRVFTCTIRCLRRKKGKTEVISQETMMGAGGEWKAAELSNEFLLGSNLKSAQLEFATPERRVFGGK